MSKIMNSSYNAYSSGLSSFRNESTSDTSSFQLIPIHELVDAPDNGRYSVFDIANWFLSKEPMTQKKLQKLCYYAQAWCYALNNYRLMDTVFEAWIHGPVSPPLYDKFKNFGYNSIRIAGKYVSNIADGDVELLESVWETYGDHVRNVQCSPNFNRVEFDVFRRKRVPETQGLTDMSARKQGRKN